MSFLSCFGRTLILISYCIVGKNLKITRCVLKRVAIDRFMSDENKRAFV